MKAIYTVGVSASGKSYWADKQKDFQVISRDNARLFLLKEKCIKVAEYENMWRHWNFKWENEVNEVIEEQIQDAVANKRNIIFADTNLNQDRLRGHRNKMEQLGYYTELKYFPISYETAIERDRKRVHSVGQATIDRQWNQWIDLNPNATGIRKYKRDDYAPSCVLVDIDGTVAKMNDRSPFEWDRVWEDECNWHVCKIVQALAKYDRELAPKIIFFSGRDGVCYDDTKDWIERFFPDMEFELYMRKAGDMRRDSIVKAEMFFEHIEPNYNVMCVFDDRKQVVRMWTDIGLDVINVGDHYEDF